MKGSNKVILGLVIVGSLLFFYNFFYDGTQHFLSTVDNKSYKVRDPNKQLKANLLAILNSKLGIITFSLKNNPSFNKQQNVLRLINNWESGVTLKEIGRLESDAAYVINKKHMSFCLKDFNSLDITDVNLLTYVGIHELAHIMSDEIGHGDEFKLNFKFLLDYSKGLKYNNDQLYIPLNQIKTPDNYCGVSIINSIN